MLLFASVLACHGPDPGGGDTAAADSGAGDTGSGLEEPPLDIAAVQDGAAVALSALQRTVPLHLHDLYEGVRVGGDSSCPWRSDAYVGQDYWEDDCGATDGSTWYGWVLSARAQEMRSEAEHRNYHEFGWYFGFGRITTADGAVFNGWGSDEFRVWDADDGSSKGFFASVAGTFDWTGADAGWLAEGANHGWPVDGERDSQGTTVDALGGMSLLPGTFDAFAFDSVVFDQAGTGCLDEPAGALRLHHGPTQRWYVLSFDPSTACDGCGALSMSGEDLGTACLDWSFFTKWSAQPWEDAG